MSNYKPYKKYKPSNIAWLGDIPEHWLPTYIKGITNTYSEKDKPDAELLSVYRDYGVIKKSSRDDNHNKPGMDLSGYKVVYPNTLVLNKMKTWSGSLGVSNYFGIVSPAYITCNIDLEKVYTRFINYLLRCKNYVFEYNRLSYGVRPSQWDMRYQDFKSVPVYLPSLPEQTSIASFLDYKTAKINRFIRKKKQLIKLLNEQKAAIINDAVTGKMSGELLVVSDKRLGISDKLTTKNSPLTTKSSGIEWLGDIPEHWEVRKLKYVADCFPSNIDKHSKENEKPIRLCNYTDVYKNDYITNDMNLMVATASDEQVEKFTLQKGDVIITKDSETADDIANPALVVEELNNVVCGYHLSVLRPYSILEGSFLLRVLQCKVINIQFEICSNGVTRVGLGVYDMKSAKIPLPPLSEQQAIVSHIETETAIINKTIATIEKEIALVEEYKTALIAEAVTGKIDVREYCLNQDISGLEDEQDLEGYEMTDEETDDISMAAEGKINYSE